MNDGEGCCCEGGMRTSFSLIDGGKVEIWR
jgi:hypothetical protein